MDLVLWALGALAAVMGFIAARLWAHVVECGSERRHTDSRIASQDARIVALEADMERAKVDIGTHDTGMRGNIHALQYDVGKHDSRIETLEKYDRPR